MLEKMGGAREGWANSDTSNMTSDERELRSTIDNDDNFNHCHTSYIKLNIANHRPFCDTI